MYLGENEMVGVKVCRPVEQKERKGKKEKEGNQILESNKMKSDRSWKQL